MQRGTSKHGAAWRSAWLAVLVLLVALPVVAQERFGLRARFGLPARDDDLRAGAHEPFGDRAADAAGSARDQRQPPHSQSTSAAVAPAARVA